MKKFTKCIIRLVGAGAVLGGTFAYLKKKGYITVTTGNGDEDYDNFSAHCTETERTYVNVDTEAIKEKAKEVAKEVKDKTMEKAESAASNVADAVEKAWYKAEDAVEEVEEFFNDEE